jgi:hypothetical protein
MFLAFCQPYFHESKRWGQRKTKNSLGAGNGNRTRIFSLSRNDEMSEANPSGCEDLGRINDH